MGMNVGQGGDDDPMMEINTTPLIDVMLVLLIMLIITIPIQTHAVRLDMPVNVPQVKPPEPPVVIRIDIEGDGSIKWNGELLADRNLLESKFYEQSTKQPQPEFHIRPNRKAAYKHVAMVLTSAQRLGLQKLGVVGNEQFLE